MFLKYCNICSNEKPLKDFYKKSSSKDGLDSNCKDCCKARTERYRKANPEKVKRSIKSCYERNGESYRKTRRQYYRNNSKAAVERARKWSLENPEKMKYHRTRWKRGNKDKVNASTAKRRARLRNAAPLWLDDIHWKDIEEFYKEARLKSEVTGVEHHVDHIIPLNSKLICGLHVPWNLQVIEAGANLTKSNKILEELCLN